MPVPILNAKIEAYLKDLVPLRPEEMARMESYADRIDFPIIGPVCGHLCYLITCLSKATQVFELGSGFGYSTAWFAMAVKANGGGIVHHVVRDQKLSNRARCHLKALGLEHLVQFHVGEAVEVLRSMPGSFDLIFNDIDKDEYPDALAVIGKKLELGGILIADNLLWKGRIFDVADCHPSTEGVRELTRRVCLNEAWVASVIPIRDGLMVAYKNQT